MVYFYLLLGYFNKNGIVNFKVVIKFLCQQFLATIDSDSCDVNQCHINLPQRKCYRGKNNPPTSSDLTFVVRNICHLRRINFCGKKSVKIYNFGVSSRVLLILYRFIRRLPVQWFNFQFISPDLRVYSRPPKNYEHKRYITKERKNGLNCKPLFVDKLSAI